MTPAERTVFQFALSIFLRSIQLASFLLGALLAIWFAAFLLRLIGFALGF